MSIIRAIVAGERNPHELAALKDRRIQSSTEQIAKALTGDYRAEHLFVLQQELTLYDIYQQQISAIDREIENCLAKFESQTEDSPPPRKGKKRKKVPGNEPDFNLHRHLFRLSGVDFTQIDGRRCPNCADYSLRSRIRPQSLPYSQAFLFLVRFMPWFSQYGR